MSATDERNRASHVAKTDFDKALQLSLKVSEPWFRCQALASTARYAPDDQVRKTAELAIHAATTATDSYQRVAATAWPLRALMERNQEQHALRLLPGILEASARIENPVSRSDALFLLWQAYFPAESHNLVLGALVQSCAGHWKADYILRDVVLTLASVDMDRARDLAAGMPEGKYQRQAAKRLAAGEQLDAWAFFESISSG